MARQLLRIAYPHVSVTGILDLERFWRAVRAYQVSPQEIFLRTRANAPQLLKTIEKNAELIPLPELKAQANKRSAAAYRNYLASAAADGVLSARIEAIRRRTNRDMRKVVKDTRRL